jgi:MFS family permease
LLWASQGCVMMSYPEEKDKGRAFSVFWSIFQLGNLVGSAIALGLQSSSKEVGVSTVIYLVIIIIMGVGLITALFVLPPSKPDHCFDS